MLTHQQVWDAIDALARSQQLSPSALAKKAGLDPTTFNRSKRASPGGKLRWPSTESLSKVLDVTGMSLDDFVAIVREKQKTFLGDDAATSLPGFADCETGVPFESELTAPTPLLKETSWPTISSKNAIALEVSGNFAEPLFRDGSILLVSKSAKLAPSDRIVITTKSGKSLVRILNKKEKSRLKLSRTLDEKNAENLSKKDIDWMAKILWASQ